MRKFAASFVSLVFAVSAFADEASPVNSPAPSAPSAPNVSSGPTVYNPYYPNNVVPYFYPGTVPYPGAVNWGSPIEGAQLYASVPQRESTPPSVTCNCQCPPVDATQQAGEARAFE